jgi:hypothetical protein
LPLLTFLIRFDGADRAEPECVWGIHSTAAKSLDDIKKEKPQIDDDKLQHRGISAVMIAIR